MADGHVHRQVGAQGAVFDAEQEGVSQSADHLLVEGCELVEQRTVHPTLVDAAVVPEDLEPQGRIVKVLASQKKKLNGIPLEPLTQKQQQAFKAECRKLAKETKK